MAIKLSNMHLDVELQVTAVTVDDDATMELGALGELAVTVARVLAAGPSCSWIYRGASNHDPRGQTN